MRKISYVPIAILVSFILLIDCYVFQGVKVLTNSLQDQSIQNWIHLGYWVECITIIGAFLYNLFRSLSIGKITTFFSVTINVFIILFVTKLMFLLVLIGEDLYRVFAVTVNGGLKPARQEFVSQLALTLAAFPFFSFLYGVTKGKYNYKIHEVILHFDDLPESFNDFKIVQISDIHAGSFDNRTAVERGIRIINAQDADLVVFTGDLVNNKSDEIVPWIDVFSRIEAKFGKYSILGNHDYGDYIRWNSIDEKSENLANLKKYHQQMGFRLLLDEHVKIKREDQEIALVGVENWGLGFGQRGDLKKALTGTGQKDFKILLSHDPTHWQSVVKNYRDKIHLTLSGHTHGMQFGIEALGIKWSPVKYRYSHWAGLTSENEMYLYINRGFGFLGFSGRVGIWPEITVITLKRGGDK